MSVLPNQLTEYILDFMATIYDCYAGTNFANDRAIYSQDIAIAMGWLVDLRNGAEPVVVIEKIKNDQTSKHFGDCWRGGRWGENEAAALERLRNRCNEV